jgi:putative transposase
MQEMGIEAIYPKKRLTVANPEHKKYPYLLRGREILKCDEVWCSDITYIPITNGFAYLVAVMDWYSRYILSYLISTSLESDFCVEALGLALKKSTPYIFNTDQGPQFTSEKFTSKLKNRDILISMDGRGRALDNIMVERFWRTIKYEDIYIRGYSNIKELTGGVDAYIKFYNNERPHSSLGNQTPQQFYLGQSKFIKKIA